MKTKPTEEGYYAWREYGKITPNTEICRVFLGRHDNDLRVDFGITDFHNELLSEVAEREWFKVEGL